MSRLLLPILLVLSAVVVPSAAFSQSAKPQGSRLSRLAQGLREVGITVNAGVVASVPMVSLASGNANIGFRKAGKDDPRGSGPFADVGANAGTLGERGVVSPNSKLRGRERSRGPVARGNPVYGDRVSVGIIPGILSISASRHGGLGIGFSGIPLGLMYLVRGSVGIYVSHPKLARPANWVLDKADAVQGWAARKVEPVRRKLRPVTEPFARAARRAGRYTTRIGHRLRSAFSRNRNEPAPARAAPSERAAVP